MLRENKMKKIGIWLFLCIPLLSAHMPGNDENLYEARMLYFKGDYSGALRFYRVAIQQDPKSEIAHIGLIRSLWKNDEVQEAYKSVESALAKFPDSALLHAVKGDVLFRMAQISNAQKSYIKAISLDPGSARGYRGLGKIHAFDFNHKTARKMMQKAYEYDPADPDIVCDYIPFLTDVEQLPILEKYLRITAAELKDRRSNIVNQLEYLKNTGGFNPGGFKDPPQEAIIPLYAVTADPNRPYTGYNIKAIINGKTANLQLDSGGNGILLQRRFTEKLRLNIITASQVQGIGDSGARASLLAQAQSVQIGPLHYSNARVEVVDHDFTADADGIIGCNFFKQFMITLNFPKNRMELRPLPMIREKPYSDPESWKDLDRTACPETASFQPMGILGNLFIPVQVNNKKTGFFMLDTGSAASMLSREFATGLIGLTLSYGEIRGISGSMKTYETTADVILKMGQFRQRQPSMFAISFKEINRDYGFEISGIIGNSLLQHLAITIDYRDGYINFVYPK